MNAGFNNSSIHDKMFNKSIKQALKEATALLAASGTDNAANDAAILLCYLTGRNRAYLYAHGEDILGEDILGMYRRLTERRCEGVPLQYLTGHQEFMSLDFEVNESVLIPRQETEILVETIIEEARKFSSENNRQPEILDIGTGSGCIAVSVAYYLPGCRLTAVDISPGALEVARANARRNGVENRIDFIESDLFEAIKNKKFDIIVSNPPYIPHEEIPLLQREVAVYEPRLALDGGKDGMDFYRRIINEGDKALNPGGILAFEVGIGQARAVADLMNKKFSRVKIIKDFSGTDRVVYGSYNLDN